MTCVISGLEDCPPLPPGLELAPSCHSDRHYLPRHHCHHQLTSGVNRYYCLYFLPITGANFVMALLALEPPVPVGRPTRPRPRTIARPQPPQRRLPFPPRASTSGNRPEIFPPTSRTGGRITIIPLANMTIISANTAFPLHYPPRYRFSIVTAREMASMIRYYGHVMCCGGGLCSREGAG